MDTMGERIIYLRECLDMRQTELANKIGVTKMTMYKYEKNICEPRAQLIGALADALFTTTDYLIGRTNDKSPLKINLSLEKTYLREEKFMLKFRALTDENKIRITERIDVLIENQNK